MKVSEYTPYTVIMRGYSYEQAEAIVKAMHGFENEFSVEMTLNTEDALQHIKRLNETFGDTIHIGAGTVRSVEDARNAIASGAKFLLGPHMFDPEIFKIAQENEVVTVPAAMTPSEVDRMVELGADIVKIFPAAVVAPRFFKDIQAPLGKLRLMAVGGVSLKNAKEFLDNGASYLGLGSGMFEAEDLATLNVAGLHESLAKLAALGNS